MSQILTNKFTEKKYTFYVYFAYECYYSINYNIYIQYNIIRKCVHKPRYKLKCLRGIIRLIYKLLYSKTYVPHQNVYNVYEIRLFFLFNLNVKNKKIFHFLYSYLLKYMYVCNCICISIILNGNEKLKKLTKKVTNKK